MNSLSKNEFSTLLAVMNNPGASQRALAEAAGLGLSTLNTAYHSICDAGLVDDGRVTPLGMAALRPYQVDNAIIMAAGLSSRFAPISYEQPKGLLRVRGEVLIERQIKQLKEAGISDIVVVVGYKKEQFFYLEEKFGVHIVVNPLFASHNNNSTLYYVRQMLANSFICSSDNYFVENPFERFVYGAYYAAQYADGETSEWCMKMGARDRIVEVREGGQDSWFMVGHAYFDREFSLKFVEILEEEFDKPKTANKLWEELYAEHVDELCMSVRKYPENVIYEFDFLDELREFDPLFLENLDSSVFDNIVAVLGCEKSEIRDVYPLKQGLTNLSCHFATNEGEFVYRHPGIGTEEMLDRSTEAEAQNIALRLGLDNTFIFENPRRGWKISKFITNARQLDVSDDKQLERAMEMARKLHEEDVSLPREFDYLSEGLGYQELLEKKGPIKIQGYDELADMARRVKAYAEADNCPKCLTHNDFFNLNLLLDEQDNLYLIDWEYAGMADYASDYGTFVVTCMLDEERARLALEMYFGRKPTDQELRHNFAYVGLAGWCWYVWSLQKESVGDYVGEWLLTYYRYAKKYLPMVLQMYQEAEKEE